MSAPVHFLRPAYIGASLAAAASVGAFEARAAPPAAPPGLCGEATSTTRSGSGGSIPDVATANFQLAVSGLGPALWDLDLVTSIGHSAATDLQIFLTSPAGTTVSLSLNNGGLNDNVFLGTLWDDQAHPEGAAPYEDAPYVPGLVIRHRYQNDVLASPLVPEQPLGRFIGEDPNGTWTLSVRDIFSSDVGSLDDWELRFTTLADEIVRETAVFMQTTPVEIPAAVATVTSVIPVSGLAHPICDIDVRTNITHTYNQDLQIALTAPSGRVVTLSVNNGEGYDDVFDGTLWDDDAPIAVFDASFTNGVAASTLAPDEVLSAFTGEVANGDWTLTVHDVASRDPGSIDAWSLFVTTCRAADEDGDGIGDACEDDGSGGAGFGGSPGEGGAPDGEAGTGAGAGEGPGAAGEGGETGSGGARTTGGSTGTGGRSTGGRSGTGGSDDPAGGDGGDADSGSGGRSRVAGGCGCATAGGGSHAAYGVLAGLLGIGLLRRSSRRP